MKITGFTGWLVEHEPGPDFIWRDGLHGSHGATFRAGANRARR
jgi:hypothetical protein